MTPDERFGDYHRAKIEVDLTDRRIIVDQSGENSQLPTDVDGPIFVITAWNPGRELPLEENESRQRRLETQLDAEGRRWFPARGGDVDGERRHVERSAVVVGLTRAEAVELGTTFGQDAIFEWTRDHLIVLRCPRRADATDVLSADGRGRPGVDQSPRVLTDGRCTRYSPGHRLHEIQARKTGETPWGWRDAVVVGVSEGVMTLRYLIEDVEFDAWHHVDLAPHLPAGSPVRVNQSWGCVLQGPIGLINITHNSPLKAVPTPGRPELWFAEVKPGIVEVATGRGVDLATPDPELP